MGKRTLVLVVVFMLIATIQAFAHKPIFEKGNSKLEKPSVIPNHKISYAVYGRLKDKSDVDFVKFSAKKGDEFFIQLAIPVMKGNQGFNPHIALIGKNLYRKDEVPFKVPEGYNVVAFPPSRTTPFYQKFTQTSYNMGTTIRGEILEDGDYYVAIYSSDKSGNYSLGVGEEEKFGFIDILKFPYTYLRVKYFFNPAATILVILGIIFLIGSLTSIIKSRIGR